MTQKRDRRSSHQNREDLTGEHAVGDAGQIILACLFAITWTADTFLLKFTTGLSRHIPLGIRIALAVVIFVLSYYLAKTGLSIVFGEIREKPAVIRKGVFNIVRHPVYLGEILLYLGFLILNISLAALVVWLIAIIFLHYISRHEERLLLARFGDAYAQYMRQVPMWIPRFRN